MQILYLTGGAGQMYCGSCLRDNALATELIARGHDVTLLPVYTPTLTDETNVSRDRIFFGGISVYLEQYFPLFRKTPRWLDRLWDSRFMLDFASRRSISTSPKMLGEMTVSMLRGENGYQLKEIEKLVEWLKHETLPDVISLPYSLLLGLAKPLKEALDRPIVCTLQGEDLFLDGLLEPYRSESKDLIRKHSDEADAFIAVSDYYAEFMPRYLGIPRSKIHVVPLGINLEDYERKTRHDRHPFTVGYFARIAPEKGLHVLADAYRILRDKMDGAKAHLEVAGYLAPEHHSYLKDIEQKLKAWGLDSEFKYHGVVDREHKISFLQGLDVLTVPATYQEPKGVFLLEAMACGVPVVQPDHGAFSEIVERTGGGILVEPDNPGSLADGLNQVRKQTGLAERLAENAFTGVRRHYSVQNSAERALEVYESVIARPTPAKLKLAIEAAV
jgi:glycosyltransferase involved in cell wall biosynthesis